MLLSMLRIWWVVYHWLRTTEPLTGVYPDPGFPKARTGPVKPSPHANIADTRKERFLDEFVVGHCDTWLQIQYVWATLSLQWRTRIMGIIGGE